VRSEGSDGYKAVQLGFSEIPEKRLNKPELGHLKRWQTPPVRHLREFRFEEGDYTPGQSLTVEGFKVGETVDIVGKTKGRGFQGVVKRHRFAGGKETHGVKTHDSPGSIGMSAYPARVIKGKKLPGQMGNTRKTARNLKIVAVDVERNLLMVRGAVPGPRNGIVLVRSTGRMAKE
jgi:large subunit ribosomal protein L3